MPESSIKHDFQAQASSHHKKMMSSNNAEEKRIGTTLSDLYAGATIEDASDGGVDLGIAIHDGTYSIDFAMHHFENLGEQSCEDIQKFMLNRLGSYRDEHGAKFIGMGIGQALHRKCPKVASALWLQLDIIPFVLDPVIDADFEEAKVMKEHGYSVDEQADSLARKCQLFFTPLKQPRTAIGYMNNVMVDSRGRILLTTNSDYEKSVRQPTWKATMKYVEDVKKRNLRIAFFNATPQGGGVALMRHALIRFLTPLGIRLEWYVPRPRPEIFRITKTNHNILQGTVDKSVEQEPEQLDKIKQWIKDNAKSYWQPDGGPLSARSKGGCDLVIVDDPQMPELIPLAKEADPDRPVIFRSHIEVRDDLVGEKGSAAETVWNSMWTSIKSADLFISHPVADFVPKDVKSETVGYLPATTDWLDGLNKNMMDADVDYYLHDFNDQCRKQGMPTLAYPERQYFCQIARFDPAKGIDDLIKSFALFRKKLKENGSDDRPQLVVTGHASVDDPDGTKVFDENVKLIEEEHSDLKDDIIMVRLGPIDQLLNAVISKAKVVLQLSTREGFEVKVSEAIHKGKPTIATQTGGIPLQVAPKKNGFLVPRSDAESVANHLYDLYTDQNLWDEMSDYALHNVSDEVSTVGNALSWMYLASKLCPGNGRDEGKGEELKPNGRWINDMAREEAGFPYEEGEPRLPRDLAT